MTYKDTAETLNTYRRQIVELREKMRQAQASVEPEKVADYVFSATTGAIKLSELFDGKSDLIVIHNMGASCAYCTLWADGFNGIYHHLASRAGFVVSTPDRPQVQQTFAAGRGWRFPMVSHQNTSFATDMGYGSATEGWRPGISAFRSRDGQVLRVSDSSMGPGDDFCSLWHIFDLLADGANGWRPQYHYS